MSAPLEEAFLRYLKLVFHGYAPEPTTPEEAETVETLRVTFFAGARVYQKLAAGEEQDAMDEELLRFKQTVSIKVGGDIRFVVVEEVSDEPKP
jgi:hypothetical protein